MVHAQNIRYKKKNRLVTDGIIAGCGRLQNSRTCEELAFLYTCHMCSGLDVWYLLPIGTDNAISPLRALLWEVRYRTKAFNIR